MAKRTEYRRWDQGMLKEELILTEEGDGSVLVTQDENGDYTVTECGFRGDYGEVEPVFAEEEEDDGEDKAKGS